MDGSSTESGGSGGVPAPFVVKTYEMVNDPSSDEIISWSPTSRSFIVRNPTEFCRRLLCHYFKHNNFSSFIRQLNSYGFRKINHDQWEFANEYFAKDQYHLLVNIHRKKAVHSHSVDDLEMLAFEEEIEKLANEKASIESNTSSFKQHMEARKFHMGNLEQRLDGMEQRQKNLLSLFQRVLRNPKSVEQIYQKIGSENFIGCDKKRRFLHVAGNEDGESGHHKIMGEGELPEETQRIATLGFVSSKETSFVSYSPSDSSISESEKRLSSEQKSEESHRDQTLCPLSLSLASSPTQDSSSPEIDYQEIGNFVTSRLHANDKNLTVEEHFQTGI